MLLMFQTVEPVSYHNPLPGDSRFMQAALAYARGALGTTWPNPAVACLLVKDGAILARGRTQPGGRPHAETVALAQAGDAARGATAYVTLEPCSHHGQTPPCAEALIAAGVARVVAACRDDDARVNGAGLARLAAAGIAVTVRVLEAEALALNEGFFHRLGAGRPFVTVKVATSLDGKIALQNGDSKWITGIESRRYVQQLRARSDAILTTAATALKDEARLTLRDGVNSPRPPVRILLDRQGRVPPHAPIFQGEQETWVYGRGEGRGVRHTIFIETPLMPDAPPLTPSLNLLWILQDLAARGITSVLVEAGAVLNSALLEQNLVQRWIHCTAPKVLGQGALPMLTGIAAAAMPDNWRVSNRFRLGDDSIAVFEKIQLI